MAPDYPNFVGRENELNAFRRLLKSPKGKVRILFILGEGGTGKTLLVKRMLEVAKEQEFLAPDEPIDLFSTDYRHIDGIQWRVKEIVENLTGLNGSASPFAGFVKGETDTSEKFYECLKAFCAEHPLVLAFDTFENLDKVASDWLFRSEAGGLQVPGLICIIAGRYKKDSLEKYRQNAIVRETPISGFTLEEAEEFYKKLADEFVDPLGAFLRAAGKEHVEGIEWIWKVTKGHPLRLEMAFRWSNLLENESLVELTADKFEEQLMAQVREFAEMGRLDAGPDKKITQPVYDTLVCMAYVTRRFDEDFLRHLIKIKLIHLDSPKVSEGEILENLEKYFFVKVRPGREERPIIQLHDEMARLVREYVWPYLDNSVIRKQTLLETVDQYYDQLIARNSGEEADILRVEQLYYALQRDWKGEGKRRWFELAEMRSESINKLLPGEIEAYLKDYDMETRVAFHNRIAQIESDARHRNQALAHWEEMRKLGEAEGRADWMVDALVGKFNTVYGEDAEKAYKSYLLPARRLAEAKAPERLALVYYEIGFAYRQMQKIEKAVYWYSRALVEQRKSPEDKARKATILNDRGYAYTYLGRWGFTTRDVGNALRIRQGILQADREQLAKAEPGEKERLQRAVVDSARRVGMSHNTLGDFGRYADHLDDALKQYTDALKLFEEANDNYWQAKALCGLGETYRRLAFDAKHRGDFAACEEQMAKALDHMQSSLYLCQRYQIDDERDTACRRIGRLYHDRALIAKEQGQGKKVIRENLIKAHDYFEEGLQYALKTNDDLEELENLTEMAFLLDDAIDAFGEKNVPVEFRNALERFEEGLEKHRNDRLRLHQFPVFENLLRLEHAAIAFAKGNYPEALNEYLEAYKGLGSLAGYGVARYRQHRDHLKTQIRKLPREDQKKWCQKFVETWETTIVPRSKPKRYLADDLPDLVEWCYLQLKILN